MLDWLRLIRASGLFTIASNTLAAILVCAAGDDLHPVWLIKRLETNGWTALWIPVASFCLYASGMLWNDLNDLERDRVLNPRRPLPSGRIGLSAAFVVGVLFAVGALAAGYMAAGRTGFDAAGVVLILALLYDFAAKDVPYVGSVVMGLVRASHATFAVLLLGRDYFTMALHISPTTNRTSVLLSYPLILGCYIVGLTLISELESRKSHRWELLLGGATVALAIAMAVMRVLSAPWIVPLERWGAAGPVVVTISLAIPMVIVCWLLALIGRPYLQALHTGKQALVGATVFAGLAGIILLDAIVAGSAHPLGALLIIMLFPLFRTVGALIRMD